MPTILSGMTHNWNQNVGVFSLLPIPPHFKQQNVAHRQRPPTKLRSLFTQTDSLSIKLH
jgi:hypothetical protein